MATRKRSGPKPNSRAHLFLGLPAKGTKMRKLLTCLLSPKGITSYEFVQMGLGSNAPAMRGYIEALSDQRGWDVRSFICTDPSRMDPSKKRMKHNLIYKIVGRVRPNRYRALSNISLEQES